jgi:hypothetical protein
MKRRLEKPLWREPFGAIFSDSHVSLPVIEEKNVSKALAGGHSRPSAGGEGHAYFHAEGFGASR